MTFLQGTLFKAQYRLHTRCHNCRLLSQRILAVPDCDDAPDDIEELLQSELLNRVPFSCDKCECPIGTIVGVSPHAG